MSNTLQITDVTTRQSFTIHASVDDFPLIDKPSAYRRIVKQMIDRGYERHADTLRVFTFQFVADSGAPGTYMFSIRVRPGTI